MVIGRDAGGLDEFRIGSKSFWSLEVVLVLVCRTCEALCTGSSQQKQTGDHKWEVRPRTWESIDANLWRIFESTDAEGFVHWSACKQAWGDCAEAQLCRTCMMEEAELRSIGACKRMFKSSRRCEVLTAEITDLSPYVEIAGTLIFWGFSSFFS